MALLYRILLDIEPPLQTHAGCITENQKNPSGHWSIYLAQPRIQMLEELRSAAGSYMKDKESHCHFKIWICVNMINWRNLHSERCSVLLTSENINMYKEGHCEQTRVPLTSWPREDGTLASIAGTVLVLVSNLLLWENVVSVLKCGRRNPQCNFLMDGLFGETVTVSIKTNSKAARSLADFVKYTHWLLAPFHKGSSCE